MSHLTQIRTKIQSTKILEKTLTDLKFIYQLKHNQLNIEVKDRQERELEFIWNGYEYSIAIDIQMWESSTYVNSVIEQITQQYSYNSIIEQSTIHGFTHINKESMIDGSIKLTVQRWN